MKDFEILWEKFKTFQKYYNLEGKDLKIAKSAYYSGFINLKNLQIEERGKILKEFNERIDEASYDSLLRRWRFAIPGDPIFQGEAGKYYAKVLGEAKKEIGNYEHVKISKRIGWDR